MMHEKQTFNAVVTYYYYSITISNSITILYYYIVSYKITYY